MKRNEGDEVEDEKVKKEEKKEELKFDKIGKQKKKEALRQTCVDSADAGRTGKGSLSVLFVPRRHGHLHTKM